MQVLISHRDDVKLEEMSLSKDFLAVAARKNALKVCPRFDFLGNLAMAWGCCAPYVSQRGKLWSM